MTYKTNGTIVSNGEGFMGIFSTVEMLNGKIQKIEELEKRLAEAEKVIGFYGQAESWKYPGNDFANFHIDWSDLSNTERKNSKGKSSVHKCGGKRAREYIEKYGEKNEN